MSTELVHVGFGNFVAANRIVAAVLPTSAPIQRLVRDSKKKGTIKDITQGRRTKAVLLMDDGSIILAAITPEAIVGRVRSTRLEQARWAERLEQVEEE